MHEGFFHGNRPQFGPNGARNCQEKRNREQKTARQGRHNNNPLFSNGGGDKDQNEPAFNCLSSVCFLAKKTKNWYADYEANHHMTDQRHFFTTHP